jgi:hypothetical protein
VPRKQQGQGVPLWRALVTGSHYPSFLPVTASGALALAGRVAGDCPARRKGRRCSASRPERCRRNRSRCRRMSAPACKSSSRRHRVSDLPGVEHFECKNTRSRAGHNKASSGRGGGKRCRDEESLWSELRSRALTALNRDPRQRIAGCSQIACLSATLLPRTFSFH